MRQTFTSFSARLGEFIRHASRLPEGSRAVEREAEFDALALAMFALQFEHNPAYRNLCAARSVNPSNVSHWTQIPPAPTAAFKELELTSLPASERATVFHSSGTAGQRPSRHFHDRDSLAIYEASLLPWFQRHLLPELFPAYEPSVCSPGFSPPDMAGPAKAGTTNLSRQPQGWTPTDARGFQFISLTPTAAAAPHSSLVHMFDSLHRALGSADSFFAGSVTSTGVWTLDSQKLLTALRDASRPVVLLGTAFTFVGLLDDLAAPSLRLRLPAGSRALETGGYKGRSRSLPKRELHALITDRLGIAPDSIVCEYGMSELSSQAYDSVVSNQGRVPGDANDSRYSSPVTRHFQFPPWARVQIISPESGLEVAEGETGLIRVFDLANVFSVMAIQTEDLGVRGGDGFELLGRAAVAVPRGCSLMAD